MRFDRGISLSKKRLGKTYAGTAASTADLAEKAISPRARLRSSHCDDDDIVVK
jgi:hypothetical protein